LSLASWWRVPIRSVLDVGAGKGYWRDWLEATRPQVSYHGIDASEYACRRYGHEHADVDRGKPPRFLRLGRVAQRRASRLTIRRGLECARDAIVDHDWPIALSRVFTGP
jgi:hypothetical protein